MEFSISNSTVDDFSLMSCSGMPLESKPWSSLPDHIIVNIFSYLSPGDRRRAGSTCRAWNNCSKSPYLWQRFSITFTNPSDGRSLECLDQYAQYLRSVSIFVNQYEFENSVNACKVLHKLSHVEERRLNSLRIKFTGDNPNMHFGSEFVVELKLLFEKRLKTLQVQCQLRHVDLSELHVLYDDTLLDVLSENNPQLETLNIINYFVLYQVTPECIQRLVERCWNLTDIRLFHCIMTDDVLRAFAKPGRTPLKHMSIVCMEVKTYSTDLTSEAWAELIKQCPNLRVALGFDSSFTLHNICFIMKPEIPVKNLELSLGRYKDIYDELNQASHFYRDTLEKVIIETRNSPELANSLINLCSNCPKLTKLLVYCVLEKEIVEKILDLCPEMKERGSYILDWGHKWERGLEERLVGVKEGDLMSIRSFSMRY